MHCTCLDLTMHVLRLLRPVANANPHSGFAGNGVWSAMFGLPDDNECPEAMKMGCGKYGRWPASGELDLFEHVNQETCISGTSTG